MASQAIPKKTEHYTHAWIILLLFGTTISVFLVLSWAYYGSVRLGILAIAGKQLVSEVGELSVGTLEVGEQRVLVFHLRNLTGRPINIVGSQSKCTCTSAEKLPLVVPPGGRLPLRVTYRADKAANVNETMRLFTDSERNRQLVLSVSGRVIARIR
jgi:Protein of unknown function (DUF1573)